jgi:hypothetical protein
MFSSFQLQREAFCFFSLSPNQVNPFLLLPQAKKPATKVGFLKWSRKMEKAGSGCRNQLMKVTYAGCKGVNGSGKAQEE